MQYRQGDIFLQKIEQLPTLEDNFNLSSIEGPEQKDSIVLALGEATGHAHAIRNNKDKSVVLVKEKNNINFFIIVKKQVDLTHEEHSKITLPVGNYQVIRQREYTPTKIIQVAD